MENTQGERVRIVRDFLGLNQSKFAKTIGVTAGAIWQIEKNNGVSLDTLTKIASIHSICISWLTDGKGEMLYKKEVVNKDNQAKNEGAKFLSADTLYNLWQEERKERMELTQTVIQLASKLNPQNNNNKAKQKIAS